MLAHPAKRNLTVHTEALFTLHPCSHATAHSDGVQHERTPRKCGDLGGGRAADCAISNPADRTTVWYSSAQLGLGTQPAGVHHTLPALHHPAGKGGTKEEDRRTEKQQKESSSTASSQRPQTCSCWLGWRCGEAVLPLVLFLWLFSSLGSCRVDPGRPRLRQSGRTRAGPGGVHRNQPELHGQAASEDAPQVGRRRRARA